MACALLEPNPHHPSAHGASSYHQTAHNLLFLILATSQRTARMLALLPAPAASLWTTRAYAVCTLLQSLAMPLRVARKPAPLLEPAASLSTTSVFAGCTSGLHHPSAHEASSTRRTMRTLLLDLGSSKEAAHIPARLLAPGASRLTAYVTAGRTPNPQAAGMQGHCLLAREAS